MLASARSTLSRRVAGSTAARYLPEKPGAVPLKELRERASNCRACPLYRNATQTVFGEGPAHASMVLIGEQPGDQEDRQGLPFIGPAGKLLDRALEAAGIPRARTYVTNAVKHFKWRPVGKRRLHDKPNEREIRACRPWLQAELARIRPRVVVALGATAAQSLMGRSFRVTREHGKAFTKVPWGGIFFATIHPSAILRGPREQRERAFAQFVADLRAASSALD